MAAAAGSSQGLGVSKPFVAVRARRIHWNPPKCLFLLTVWYARLDWLPQDLYAFGAELSPSDDAFSALYDYAIY